jgi:RNA polymerase sigma factor for flagellar operon FliA
MNPADLFRASLALIDRTIDRVCRRSRLFGPDAEDFASDVRLALMADDYAVLRKWEQRSSLATFLTVVIQRMLVDLRVKTYGRWHPSAEAQRLGEAAVVLERMIRRDRRTIEEAVPLVRSIDPSLTRADVETLARRLPERTERPRTVDVDDTAEQSFVASEVADSRAIGGDRARLLAQTSRTVRQALGAMTSEDRAILRFHYGSSMTMADIARTLRLPQRPLYRRIERLHGVLRQALAGAGIDADSIGELIGAADAEMDFGWKTGTARPSNEDEGPKPAEERS